MCIYVYILLYKYKCHNRSVCVCEIEQHRCIITCMHVSIPHVCLFLLYLSPSIVRDTLITNIETELSIYIQVFHSLPYERRTKPITSAKGHG